MTEIKKLFRSDSDKMIAGVCAGVAEYFGLDPTLVRLGYIILCIFTLFAGVIGYLIMWLVIPRRYS